MNCEILFRGKRVDNDNWIIGSYFYDSNRKKSYICGLEYCIVDGKWRIVSHEVISKTVGQYIGLTDKNEKKIFDGDIVEVDGENEYAVVIYDSDIARFMIRWVGVISDFDSYSGTECEVIGNIHDNPELLKGVKNNDTTDI